MSRARILVALACVVTLMAAGMTHFGRSIIHMTDILGKPDLESLFPSRFAYWRVDDLSAIIAPSPDTQALLDSIYNQAGERTYVNKSGDRVMLSIVYGGDQSDSTCARLPEPRYPVQGFQVSSNTREIITLSGREVAARQLTSQRGTRMEPTTYWLLVGDRVTESKTEQKLVQFRLGLKGLIRDGMLAHMSSTDSDMNCGYKLQQVFLSDMALAIPEGDLNRVLGAPSGARL